MTKAHELFAVTESHTSRTSKQLSLLSATRRYLFLGRRLFLEKSFLRMGAKNAGDFQTIIFITSILSM